MEGLTVHERFVKELLLLYKEQRVLWDQKHPKYRSHSERKEAYEVLLNKCREYHQSVDVDFVKIKIDSMRSCFRKEHRKVKASRETADNPDDIYRPSLWYYDLLLFTTGEEHDTEEIVARVEKNQAIKDNIVRIPFWSREYTALLINLYKNEPCLYALSHPNYNKKSRRKQAIKKITETLASSTGKYFDNEDVRRKISLVRGQFNYEYKKIKKSRAINETYKPTLWCYEMLKFLKDHQLKNTSTNGEKVIKEKRFNLRSSNKRKASSSEESDEEESQDQWDETDIKNTSDNYYQTDLDNCEFLAEEKESGICNDDIYDTIGKNVAHKMRDMSKEQRDIAQKIISDLMYHGQMEQLSSKSRLSLDGK